MGTRKRGRPVGFKLSEESKLAISKSKTGQKHSEETKNKISKSLLKYFKDKYPNSAEFYDDYKQIIENDKDSYEWFSNNKDKLDSFSDIVTNKSMDSKRYRELSIDYNILIQNEFYDDVEYSDPYFIYELKELCKIHDIDVMIILKYLNICKYNYG